MQYTYYICGEFLVNLQMLHFQNASTMCREADDVEIFVESDSRGHQLNGLIQRLKAPGQKSQKARSWTFENVWNVML